MYYLKNTVSYAAMILPFMVEEEFKFRDSIEFLKAQHNERRNRTMSNIFQTIRSGKILSMFAPEHRIQPYKEDLV